MLWLVTPVHGREALTRLCFEQRARMLEELNLRGVQAHQLVVGDDANLDTAREHGFTVLERRNVLGWRVNEGFEWACTEGGATAVSYCGSDDWHLADYFAPRLAPGTARTSRLQAFVSPSGDRLIGVRNSSAGGGAPWVISRELLEPCRFRPAVDQRMRVIDGSIYTGLVKSHPGFTARHAFRHRDVGPLRVVDFKAGGEQVTPWDAIVGRFTRQATALVELDPVLLDTRDPFGELARVYPVDLVERMQAFYADRSAA